MLAGVAAILGGLIAAIVGAKADKDSLWVPGLAVMVLGIAFTLVWGIVWGATYSSTTVRIAQMQAFQDETMPAYLYTIRRTEDVSIDPAGTRGQSFTDLSYQQQGMAVSERIVEMRDLVHRYNERLAGYERKNAMPVFGSMFADVPDSLHFIRLSE